MKKRSVLIILVAITLLSTILLSSILGVTKAEYFKKLSKALDFEAGPDLALQYALWDANGTGDKEENKKCEWEDGVYKNSKSFSQDIVVGRNDAYTTGIYSGAAWIGDQKNNFVASKYPEINLSDSTKNKIAMNAENFKYNGENIVYQIKLPVDETGYYLLNFQIDFRLKTTKTPDPWASEISGFYTQHYDRAIGCEILNHDDGFTFRDSSKPLDLYTRSQNDTVYYKSQKTTADKQQNRTFEADSLYQWKTLAPSRAEKVSLAFKVEQQDVDKGYVIWMWDLAGLYGARTWRMEFTNLSVEKTMELNGSTKTRNSSVDPYFMFPQTSFMNNQYMLSLTDTSKTGVYDNPYFINENTVDGNVRSVDHQGKMSYSKGRGTFATAATANSLTFQAESLFYGFDAKDRSSATENYPGTTTKLKYHYLDEDDDAAYSNPVAVYIPLKNIQFDTDYKVTFDLSVARQGRYGIVTPEVAQNSDSKTLGNPAALTRTDFYGLDDKANGYGPCLVDYANPFATESYGNLQNQIFRKGEQLFSSYLYSGDPSVNRNENAHKTYGFTQIKYANKTYQNEPLTKYDEINSLGSFQHSVTQSVNNTYNNAYTQSGDDKHKSESRNWFNAVLHTEYNGQNEIHWVTFYNTTFSFNIPESENAGLDLNNLNWVWAMDSLISGCYYRIKLENVRIEKVVKYTSSLHPNGIKIAGTQIDPALHTVDDPSDNSKGFDATSDMDTLYNVVDTFRSFRGINGTGQNWQAKGFVLDEYTDPNVFTSEGNIYAPIIDASKFTVRPNDTSKPKDANGEHPPTADAYKIALSGFAVCEGGVEKYVFSVDGGLTWHDMTFSGTDATTEPDPEDRTARNQIALASRGVNQYVSGQTRYTEAKFTTENIDISPYRHHEFTTADGANANFSNFALVADLSEYKNDANLDVIIAAVPTENINYRCEIVRIINFNQIRNYMTFPFDFVSDISVTNANTSSESILNIHRLDESDASHKGHYHNELAVPERMGFTMAKTWKLQPSKSGSSTTDLAGPSSTTGYARMAEYSYKYEDIRTLCSDMPVKKSLSVTGWAMVEKGVQDYYWSADNGKTWTKCSGTAVQISSNNGLVSPQYADYYYSLDGRNDSTLSDTSKHRFEDSNDGAFNANTVEAKKNEFGTMLTADLSNYVGEVVDVIFAAKPNESDVYVPVGKIDNVAVYGENGTFYTRLHHVVIDQCDQYVDITSRFPDNKWLTRYDDWKIGISGYAYTIFEPNNVNVANTRLYNTTATEIQSGGRVTIDGFVVCKGGVSRYKYSLDGGKTWTVINDAGANITDSSKSPDNSKSPMITEAQKSDNSFTSANDGARGDYCCYSSGTILTIDNTRADFYKHALEFNLPALPAGAERNLLVVAESTKDKLIPVLHIKLKFKYADGNTMQYGYHHSMDREDVSQTKSGIINNQQTWGFYPLGGVYEDGSNHLYNRVTIPVTQAGKQLLTFDFRLGNVPSTKSVTGRTLYRDKDNSTNPGENFTDRTGNITLTANKTHYLEDEKISVDFTCESVKNPGSFGEVQIAIVSEDWKNQNGRQHAIYAQTFSLTTANYTSNTSNKGTWKVRVDDITKLATGNIKPSSTKIHTNSGLPEVIKNLRAGRYSIVLIHRDEAVAEVLYGTSGWDDKYLLAKTTIYIHEESEEVNFSIVHDEGEYTYFADRSRQYSIDDPNVDHIYTVTNPYACDDMRGIAAMVDVTEADVKRGYVILDCDYSKLLYAQKHPHEDCEAIINALAQNGETKVTFDGKDAKGDPNGEIFHTADRCVSPDRYKSVDPNGSYFIKQYSAYNPDGMMYYSTTLKFNSTTLIPQPANNAISIPFAGSNTGYGTTTMKIPVSAEGTYDLSFNGYLNNSVTHRGYAKSGTSGWTDPNGTTHDLALDYTGAAMSIPKTVYTVGEDIPVSYYAKGSVASKSPVKESGNLPWIGMYAHNTRSNPSTKEEIEAGRHYVQPDSSGVEYISTANLTPGVYQIYLRDNSATLFHSGNVTNEYWWQYDMVDPITVIIEDPATPLAEPRFKYDFSNVPYKTKQTGGTNGYSTGTVTLAKNVFYQGDTISVDIKFTQGNDKANYWLALYPEGGENGNYPTWRSSNSTGTYTLKTKSITEGANQAQTTSGTYTLPAGKYTLYLLNGGSYIDAYNNGRIYAVMDVTILPESMKNNVKGATQIHSLELKEGNIVAKPQDVTPTTSILDPFSYYTVNGTFTATQEDVERGYVIFEYDFSGLGSSVDLSFVIDNFTVTKRESS